MHFGSGWDFEEAIFGRHSNNSLFERYGKGEANFGKDLKELIESDSSFHPPTKIGSSIYRQVVKYLEKAGINPEGLIFRSSVDTKVDLRHYTDGFFFLPSLFPYIVTVDAFNISQEELVLLRERWIDGFSGEAYSHLDFQSDLFLYKKGVSEWKKFGKVIPSKKIPVDLWPDFRRYAKKGRPKNHFILTPFNVGTYERRREFARLVVGYLAKVSGQNLAHLSP